MTRQNKEQNQTKGRVTVSVPEVKAILSTQEDFLRPVVQQAVQSLLEVEMEECLQAGPYERADGRQGYRSGYYRRRLLTRVGTIELRVPQDRAGRFSPQVFESYARSEKALVAALAQRHVQGKVAAITEELCGHEFSAASISAITAQRDGQWRQFAERPLGGEFPYVILDARYEKVRVEGVVASRAVLVALGVDWEGRRQVLAVEVARKESTHGWKEFLLRLKERGLKGVCFVASDDHPGLKQAVSEVLPAALWQRCCVHFLRNALDYLPRQAAADCLQEMRWMYDRRDVEEARRDLQAWLEKWGGKYPKLCAWVEANIEETWTCYRLPREHHKHLKSTNVLERFNQELKRRTRVVPAVAAVAAEIHEAWMEGSRYLNMEPLREQLKKPVALPLAA